MTSPPSSPAAASSATPPNQAAIKVFGDQGTAELFYLIGCYGMISVLLNGYDVPVPE